MKVFIFLPFLFLINLGAFAESLESVEIGETLDETQNRTKRSLSLYDEKFCGTKDFTPKLGTLGKWNKNHLTYFIESYDNDMSEEDTKKGLETAFWHWSSIINIEFSETNDTNADIVIGFKRKDHNDSISFDGRGGQIAHCIGEMPCTTIHFDMDEKWRYVQMNKWLYDNIDFVTVAMHQIGHALGLGHYDEHENNIMNRKYLRPATKIHDGYLWPHLKLDEIKAIRELYGMPLLYYTYIGCFTNDLLFQDNYTAKQYDDNSPFYCAMNCKKWGYNYAGLQKEKCICGKEFDFQVFNKSDDYLCEEYRCSGYNTEYCGGGSSISVYTLNIQETETQELFTEKYLLAGLFISFLVIIAIILIVVGIVLLFRYSNRKKNSHRIMKNQEDSQQFIKNPNYV